MAVFTMPSLGADMEAGKLVEWMIKPGDTVKRGDVVAVVETQKGAIEIECFEEGTVEALDAALGTTLPVGAPLATIRAEGEAPAPSEVPPRKLPPSTPEAPPEPAPAAAAPPTPPEAEPAATAAAAPGPLPPPPARRGQAAPPPSSPAARAFAAARGIDIAGVKGAGPEGVIRLADVEAAAPGAPRPETTSAPPGALSAKPGLDMAAMRAAIATAMARSKREIPHYYLTQTIDLQPAADWLTGLNATRPPDARLLMGALFVKASALAAAQVPQMNGQFGPQGFQPSQTVHAGVAVALRGGGLIAPAIHDAETLSLDDLMAAMKDLVARARTGRLRSSEMTDGTITVSAMGETGADAMAAVIFPPQVAILGLGAPVRRPWVADGTIAPRLTVTATLSADHRVSDGRKGAKFLALFDKALQTPEAL